MIRKLLAILVLGLALAQAAQAAFILSPRVWETTTTTGTGAVTLAGAVTNYRTFASAMANGDTIWYSIVNRADYTQWEMGIGTWNTGGTLTRTTVLQSSNANAAVSFSAGTKDVASGLPPSILGFTGDCSLSSAGAITCTKTSGSTFGYFATGTDAANLTGTVTVAHGGSGIITTTAYSPIFSGTTSTGTWKADTGPGTAGQVLTSNGAGAYGTWQAAPALDAFSRAVNAMTNFGGL